jgi:hypothetical protein
LFGSFLPAISKEAEKRFNREVLGWRLHRHTDWRLGRIARWINLVGSEEISAVARVQEGRCLVESVGAGVSPTVRSLPIHPWLHGDWMVGAV